MDLKLIYEKFVWVKDKKSIQSKDYNLLLGLYITILH